MAESFNDEAALGRLAALALEQWELQPVSIVAHTQRENSVFKVEDRQGQTYALRIHRAGYHSRRALESETLWTSAMADAGLLVPEALRTRSGSTHVAVTLPDSGLTRHVGLIRWIAGVTLEDFLADAADDEQVALAFERLGRLLARFHSATETWSPPTGFERHSFDSDGLVGDQPFWGRFWEIEHASEQQRARLVALRELTKERLSALPKDPTTFGMIHADMNRNNVLIDGDSLSVIDFDDAGFGWHGFDLAVALWGELDALNEESSFDRLSAALVQGYRSERPQGGAAIAQLPLFLLMRSLMLLRWVEDRPELGRSDFIPTLLELAFEQADELGLSEV